MTFAATILTLYPEMFPGPLGVSLAGRAMAEAGEGEETLLAQIDFGEVAEGLTSLDTDGHYARPDVFELTVDTRAKEGVH